MINTLVEPYTFSTYHFFYAMIMVPPSVNHQWQADGSRFRNTKEYRQWKRVTIEQLKFEALQFQYQFPIERDVCVTLRINLDKRSDVPNYEKGIHDALEKSGILKNDNQIRIALTIRSGMGFTSMEIPDRCAEIMVHPVYLIDV